MISKFRRAWLPVAALCLLSWLLPACDRTTKHLPVLQAPETVSGPQSVPGGVRFLFESPEAQSVHLAGSFNDWSTSADPMARDGAGRWSLVRALPPGTHQYKFVINGGQQWKEDPTNPNSADDGYGGKNSLVEVSAQGTVATPQAVTLVPAAPAKPQLAVPGGPESTDGGTRFTLLLPEARSVHLAGSFNDWSTSAAPLTRNDAGLWEIVVALPSGTHQYKFVIDGGQQWKQDPANPSAADDGYGGKNSVVVVP